MITVALRLADGVHEVELDLEAGQVTVDDRTWGVDVRRNGTEAIVTVGGAVHIIDLAASDAALVDGREVPFQIERLEGVEGASLGSGGALGPVRPPMTGRIDSILVTEGQEVEAGEVLFVLEAMKMRNEIKAPATGTVASITASEGDTVDGGDIVLTLA